MLSKLTVFLLFGALAFLSLRGMPIYGADPFKGSGLTLEKGDLILMNEATQKLYMSNDVPVGTSEEWSNPNTGTHGTVTLIQKSRYKGMPCRRLRHDIVLKRPTDSYRLVVDRCRTDEGEWKIVVP